jgi:hypothetical protein
VLHGALYGVNTVRHSSFNEQNTVRHSSFNEYTTRSLAEVLWCVVALTPHFCNHLNHAPLLPSLHCLLVFGVFAFLVPSLHCLLVFGVFAFLGVVVCLLVFGVFAFLGASS